MTRGAKKALAAVFSSALLPLSSSMPCPGLCSGHTEAGSCDHAC